MMDIVLWVLAIVGGYFVCAAIWCAICCMSAPRYPDDLDEWEGWDEWH